MIQPKNKSKILYDSENESESTEQLKPSTATTEPQNTTQDAPKQWDNFVNDDIEKPVKKPKLTKQQQDLFSCQFCNKGFCRNYYLNRHLEDGRCSVKRAIDSSKEIELKAIEDAINAKLQKQELRKEKKALKEQVNKIVEPSTTVPVKVVQPKPVKPVKQVKEPKPKAVKPVPVKEENIQVEQYEQVQKYPRYIINF